MSCGQSLQNDCIAFSSLPLGLPMLLPAMGIYQSLCLVRNLLFMCDEGENMTRRRTVTLTNLVVIAAAAALLSTAACKKKTPAEKLGDKIEDVGDKIEDKADEAN